MSVQVVVQHRGSPGVLAGILGCVFGILGIFTFGILFVPLAAICSVIGLLRGFFGASASGIGTSVLAAVLSIVGFVASPSLWALVATGILLNNVAPRNAPSAPSNTVNNQTVDRVAEREKTLITFASNLQQLIGRMEKFNTNADAIIPKLSPAQLQYRAITSKINEYLVRQRELSANPAAFTIRSQISVAITQGTNATEQLHNQILSSHGEFENKVMPLMTRVNEAEQFCSRFRPSTSGVTTRGDDLVTSVCLKLTDTVIPFNQKFGTMANIYVHLEEVYQNEIRTQLQIAQASSRIP